MSIRGTGIRMSAARAKSIASIRSYFMLVLVLWWKRSRARWGGGGCARPGPESSADGQRRVHPDRPAHVEVIGRGLDHRLVDFVELLGRAVARDADFVVDVRVAGRNLVAEAEEAAQV